MIRRNPYVAHPCRACWQHPSKKKLGWVCHWCRDRAQSALAKVSPPSRLEARLFTAVGEVSGAGYVRLPLLNVSSVLVDGYLQVPELTWPPAQGRWGLVNRVAISDADGLGLVELDLTPPRYVAEGDQLRLHAVRSIAI